MAILRIPTKAMTLMSRITADAVSPGFTSRREHHICRRNADPGSGISAMLPSCRIRMFSSITLVRNPVHEQGSAAENQMVSSLPDDAEAATVEEHKLGMRRRGRDALTAGGILVMHLLSLLAPFYFTWGALWVAVGLYVVTGLFGITLSYHRNLSHRSFKLPKWLEYTFAYCGVLATQRDPIDWVSTHRYHHSHCDSDRDPHSPLHGFWFSHFLWLFDYDFMIQKWGGRRNVADLEAQPFYRFLERTWVAHPFALGLLLYSLGGLPFLIWGLGVRTAMFYHITWFVNSVCHTWGNQAWNTGDLSRNNWWVAMLTFGEGWHNNHHAFEYSARQGLEWWQVDVTWYVIRLLQAAGLATDVKLPSEAHKERLLALKH